MSEPPRKRSVRPASGAPRPARPAVAKKPGASARPQGKLRSTAQPAPEKVADAEGDEAVPESGPSCPKCEEPVETGATFCGACGAPLTAGKRRRRKPGEIARAYEKRRRTTNINMGRKILLLLSFFYMGIGLIAYFFLAAFIAPRSSAHAGSHPPAYRQTEPSNRIETYSSDEEGPIEEGPVAGLPPGQLDLEEDAALAEDVSDADVQEAISFMDWLSENLKVLIFLLYGLPALIYLGLYFWARVNPLPPSVAGLIVFLTFEVVAIVMNPLSLVSLMAWGIRIVVVGSLVGAIKSSMAQRKLAAAGMLEPESPIPRVRRTRR